MGNYKLTQPWTRYLPVSVAQSAPLSIVAISGWPEETAVYIMQSAILQIAFDARKLFLAALIVVCVSDRLYTFGTGLPPGELDHMMTRLIMAS